MCSKWLTEKCFTFAPSLVFDRTAAEHIGCAIAAQPTQLVMRAEVDDDESTMASLISICSRLESLSVDDWCLSDAATRLRLLSVLNITTLKKLEITNPMVIQDEDGDNVVLHDGHTTGPISLQGALQFTRVICQKNAFITSLTIPWSWYGSEGIFVLKVVAAEQLPLRRLCIQASDDNVPIEQLNNSLKAFTALQELGLPDNAALDRCLLRSCDFDADYLIYAMKAYLPNQLSLNNVFFWMGRQFDNYVPFWASILAQRQDEFGMKPVIEIMNPNAQIGMGYTPLGYLCSQHIRQEPNIHALKLTALLNKGASLFTPIRTKPSETTSVITTAFELGFLYLPSGCQALLIDCALHAQVERFESSPVIKLGEILSFGASLDASQQAFVDFVSHLCSVRDFSRALLGTCKRITNIDAQRRAIPFLNYLISKAADVNFEEDGLTPLIASSLSDYTPFTFYLLSHGANHIAESASETLLTLISNGNHLPRDPDGYCGHFHALFKTFLSKRNFMGACIGLAHAALRFITRRENTVQTLVSNCVGSLLTALREGQDSDTFEWICQEVLPRKALLSLLFVLVSPAQLECLDPAAREELVEILDIKLPIIQKFKVRNYGIMKSALAGAGSISPSGRRASLCLLRRRLHTRRKGLRFHDLSLLQTLKTVFPPEARTWEHLKKPFKILMLTASDTELDDAQEALGQLSTEPIALDVMLKCGVFEILNATEKRDFSRWTVGLMVSNVRLECLKMLLSYHGFVHSEKLLRQQACWPDGRVPALSLAIYKMVSSQLEQSVGEQETVLQIIKTLVLYGCLSKETVWNADTPFRLYCKVCSERHVQPRPDVLEILKEPADGEQHLFQSQYQYQ